MALLSQSFVDFVTGCPKEYLAFFMLALAVGFVNTVFQQFYRVLFRVATVFATFLTLWHYDRVLAWLVPQLSGPEVSTPKPWLGTKWLP